MERTVIADWCCAYADGCVQRDLGYCHLYAFTGDHDSASADGYRHGCANGNGHFKTDGNSDCDSHSDGRGDSYKHANPYTHSYSHAYLDANGYGDRYPNCYVDTLYSNTHTDVGSHLHTDPATSASATYEAAGDSTASTYRHAITTDTGAYGDPDTHCNTAWHPGGTVGRAL